MEQLQQSSVASQVFVGGIAGVNKKELRAYFEAYGSVLSVRLAYDCAGRRRGFGFIHFKHAASAQHASLVGLQHNIAGRLVAVQPVCHRSRSRLTRHTQAQHSGLIPETADISLLDILCQVPTLPEMLNSDSQKALSATCKSCRVRFIAQVQIVTLVNPEDYALILERRWPRVSMVIAPGVGAHKLVSPPPDIMIFNVQVTTTGSEVAGFFHATISLLRPLQNLANDVSWTPLAAQQLAHQMRIKWPSLDSFMMRAVHDLDGLSLDIVSELVKGAWINLRYLTLSGCELDAKGLLLLSQGNWPKLYHLTVSGNCLDAEGIALLVKGDWPWLTDISLSFSPTLDAGAIAIAHLSAANWSIEHLIIEGTLFTADMVAALAKLQLPYLSILALKDAGLTAATVSELARADWPDLSLLCLDLHDDDLVAVAVLLGLDGDVLKSVACDNVKLQQQRTNLGPGVALWPGLGWISITQNHVELAFVQGFLT